MKIQLDTTNMTIKIEEDINLGELYTMLDKMLPQKEWQSFKLLTNVKLEWVNPIVIHAWTNPYRYPWWQPLSPIVYPTQYDSNPCTITQLNLSQGTFNIDCHANI